MHAVEDLGLLKIDFLGLKNLTIIEETIRLVKELHGGETINISKIPLDDKKTFELLRRGDTTGVFQFESSGMRRYMKEIKPTADRRPHRARRPVPPGPHGTYSLIYQPQTRQRADHAISIPSSRKNPQKHLRRHRLPGTGDGSATELAGSRALKRYSSSKPSAKK